MDNYSYLESEAFKARYAMAAYYLRQCDHIVEIGGRNTPLWSFMMDRRRVFTVIAPGQPYTGTSDEESRFWFDNVVNYEGEFQAFSLRDDVSPLDINGLCIMGIELDCTNLELSQLGDNLELFDFVVIDYVPSNVTAQEQAHYLTFRCEHDWGLTRKVSVGYDMTLDEDYLTQIDDDGEPIEPSASFFKRRNLHVMYK